MKVLYHHQDAIVAVEVITLVIAAPMFTRAVPAVEQHHRVHHPIIGTAMTRPHVRVLEQSGALAVVEPQDIVQVQPRHVRPMCATRATCGIARPKPIVKV